MNVPVVYIPVTGTQYYVLCYVSVMNTALSVVIEWLASSVSASDAFQEM